ncbi:MAG: hypothetical protein ABI718_06530 [Acidobacteriota bacterium]
MPASGPEYLVRLTLLGAMTVIFLFIAAVPFGVARACITPMAYHPGFLHYNWHRHGDVGDFFGGLAACGGCSLVLFLVFLLPVLLSVLIAVWIYRDARRAGDANPLFWALIGFCLNLFGLLIYVIARTAAPPSPPGPGNGSPPAATV